MTRPVARTLKGLRDVFSDDLLLKYDMVEKVRRVYERYGFLPLETPAMEFVDALGKFLPESERPDAGIFALRNPEQPEALPTDPDAWLALRYDLTAPLARVVAQYANSLHRPFRRYQFGTVWRFEKPGPGRYREFIQCDFDTVGAPDVSADAEACCIIVDVLTELGFDRSEFSVKVNDRKVLQGVLEACGLDDLDIGNPSSQAGRVMRAVDKLDRLGMEGVRDLLAKGRRDETGDFTRGAELEPAGITRVEEFLSARAGTRAGTCDALFELVKDSATGREGVTELRQMDEYLSRVGLPGDVVVFDPTVVRGLGYYTGPVFEAILDKEIRDEKGQVRSFGSIYGGGRYDDLVERFTGEKVPATGASVGLDRLIEAWKLIRTSPRTSTADVFVVTLEKDRVADYFQLTQRLRDEGIKTEMFLGKGGIGKQLKYADKQGYPLAVIAGGDEFAQGVYQIKNLWLGKDLSAEVTTREEWRAQPAQQTVAAGELVSTLKGMIEQLR